MSHSQIRAVIFWLVDVHSIIPSSAVSFSALPFSPTLVPIEEPCCFKQPTSKSGPTICKRHAFLSLTSKDPLYKPLSQHYRTLLSSSLSCNFSLVLYCFCFPLMFKLLEVEGELLFLKYSRCLINVCGNEFQDQICITCHVRPAYLITFLTSSLSRFIDIFN